MSSTLLNESITLNNEYQHLNMSYNEYARWLCLMEGIEIVSKRADQLKQRTSAVDIDWIKPLAFEKYIQERFLSMKSDLEEIEISKNIKGSKIKCTTSPVPTLA